MRAAVVAERHRSVGERTPVQSDANAHPRPRRRVVEVDVVRGGSVPIGQVATLPRLGMQGSIDRELHLAA